MWQQIYDPFGNGWLSALVAALPIIFFLLALTLFKLKGVIAALLTLLVALGVAIFAFGMPAGSALAAAVYGIGTGLWPVGYIVLMAVWLYKLAVKSGKFEVIRGSIASISEDQRVQVLLIAFCFGAFLEGAAGFGVPIAICAALLTELGFKPLKAAMLCLVANAASGAYGAIGIPIIVGAVQGGMPVAELSLAMIPIVQLSTLFVPLLLVMILDGLRGARETWPVWLLIGVVFSGLQALTLYLLGPELTDIIAPLASMGVLALFMRVWQPKRIYREEGVQPAPQQRWTVRQVIAAWSPFYILTGVILVWSLPPFKALFTAGGPLAETVLKLPIPLLNGMVSESTPIVATPRVVAAVLNINLISATGTAILVAVLLTSLFSKRLTIRDSVGQLRLTLKELWIPLVTICFVMAVANVANFSGQSSTLGLALAGAGQVFPLVSPIIGWIGVFITGSVVNNNTLFAHLQVVTAQQIGSNPTLLVAANTSGGVMAKLISPQSIAIATAAVGETGSESALMRMTIRYSLALLAYVCIWTFILSRLG